MNSKFVILILALYFIEVAYGSFILSEAEQTHLEVSGQLEPSPASAKIVHYHLLEIRRLFPDVSKVFHDKKWTPGELIIPWMDGMDFEEDVQKINASIYGPASISSPGVLYPHTLLEFSKAFNPEVLGKLLEEQFGLKYIPRYNMDELQNQITFIDLSPWTATPEGIRTRKYTFKKAWKIFEEFYSHFWEFKVKNEHNEYVITLEKEYGDNLIE